MPKLKPFFKVQINESGLAASVERMQDSLEQAIKTLPSIELLDGVLLQDIALNTSPSRVEHRLGRKPVGYVVVRRSSSATVYDQADTKPEFFLNLTASAATVVSLWVF